MRGAATEIVIVDHDMILHHEIEENMWYKYKSYCATPKAE